MLKLRKISPSDILQEQCTGYLSETYANALSEFGNPCLLPESQGWILKREIPGSSYRDAMGCYPLFFCQNWSRLFADLENTDNDLVSLSLVADPLGEYDLFELRRCFKDLVAPFKTHYIVDLKIPSDQSVSAHHRYYDRKANRTVYIFRCENPDSLLPEWCELYQTLIERHKIKGIKAFSKKSFEKQMTIPGITVFCSEREDKINGMQLWYTIGDKAYHHLSAYSLEGYRLRVSYGLLGSAIRWFESIGLRWLDLGGVASISDSNDGLAKFKSGWTKLTRTALLCGVIFDHELYNMLVKETKTSNTKYFPAYRNGELTN
jgi:hypothetical protein